MIQETLLPDGQALAALLAEATADQTGPELVAKYLANCAGLLADDPSQYRSYGPYWWPLKALLVEQGLIPFAGRQVERGTVGYYTLESPELTICAAWAYQQGQASQGKLYTASHQLELAGGELYEYELLDEDMEAWILLRGGTFGATH